jgi:hypothetical protein
MKVTLDIPIGTALALKALVEKAKGGDPAVADLVAILALHGVNLQGIKLV